MKSTGKKLLLSALIFAVPVLAQAHPGHDGHDLTWSFSTGFGHPLSGWDHLRAMIAVGLWAAMLGGRARWLVPLAFIGTMAIGAACGRVGLALPGIEQGIAASLFILGLLIAFTVRLPLVICMGLVGIFALFHGWAHGAEMGMRTRGFAYGGGFVFATALLHAAGLLLGLLVKKQTLIPRITGGVIAAAGVLALAI